MVVLSVLRPSLQGGRSLLLRACSKAQCLAQTKAPNAVACRQMADHKRTMVVVPSKFEYERWKDDMHFFVLLGLIPMGLLIFYCNVFIGQAELADIPDDYEPKYWEYHKSPIVRLLARYAYDSPEKQYERTLHCLNEENEKRKLRMLDKKVRKLMSERQDYKGWYYVPMDKSRIDVGRDRVELARSLKGIP